MPLNLVLGMLSVAWVGCVIESMVECGVISEWTGVFQLPTETHKVQRISLQSLYIPYRTRTFHPLASNFDRRDALRRLAHKSDSRSETTNGKDSAILRMYRSCTLQPHRSPTTSYFLSLQRFQKCSMDICPVIRPCSTCGCLHSRI